MERWGGLGVFFSTWRTPGLGAVPLVALSDGERLHCFVQWCGDRAVRGSNNRQAPLVSCCKFYCSVIASVTLVWFQVLLLCCCNNASVINVSLQVDGCVVASFILLL